MCDVTECYNAAASAPLSDHSTQHKHTLLMAVTMGTRSTGYMQTYWMHAQVEALNTHTTFKHIYTKLDLWKWETGAVELDKDILTCSQKHIFTRACHCVKEWVGSSASYVLSDKFALYYIHNVLSAVLPYIRNKELEKGKNSSIQRMFLQSSRAVIFFFNQTKDDTRWFHRFTWDGEEIIN